MRNVFSILAEKPVT